MRKWHKCIFRETRINIIHKIFFLAWVEITRPNIRNSFFFLSEDCRFHFYKDHFNHFRNQKKHMQKNRVSNYALLESHRGNKSSLCIYRLYLSAYLISNLTVVVFVARLLLGDSSLNSTILWQEMLTILYFLHRALKRVKQKSVS